MVKPIIDDFGTGVYHCFCPKCGAELDEIRYAFIDDVKPTAYICPECVYFYEIGVDKNEQK